MQRAAAASAAGDHQPGRRRVALAAVTIGAIAAAIALFGIEARDDDYITFFVAKHLALTGSLTNINGAHVEQSSTLALVLLLAAVYAVSHAPLPVVSLVVGLVSLGTTILLAARLAERLRPGSGIAAAIVTSMSFPLLFWSTGGLETTLAAAALLWFADRADLLLADDDVGWREAALFGVACLLVTTVRPDTMVVALLVGLLVASWSLVQRAVPLARRWAPVSRRRGLGVAATIAGACIVVAAYRLIAFHQVLPEPDLAKAGGFGWVAVGYSYVVTSAPWWWWTVLLVGLAIGVVVSRKHPLGLVLTACFAVGVTSVVFSRGDWMGGARLLAPFLPPGLVLVGVGAWSLPHRTRRVALSTVAVVEATALLLFASGAIWIAPAYDSLTGPSPAAAAPAVDGSPLGASITAFSGAVPPLPWYTSWDFWHSRDAVFLSRATPVLTSLLRQSAAATVTVGSYQGGMVIATWDDEFPNRLRFFDMEDVDTATFSRCSGLRAAYGGNIITVDQWLRDAGHCAPKLPDLLFFVGNPGEFPGLLTKYHVVCTVNLLYRVDRLVGGSGAPITASEFLAVRDGWD